MDVVLGLVEVVKSVDLRGCAHQRVRTFLVRRELRVASQPGALLYGVDRLQWG